ncbi:sugar phosphate isomerase/epimerase [Granulicella sp. dw_53]|uniref:sugar phosphate isomerase/epimerase family protein n=1 Tax=Granulicella sp. dw_53 TaxID=2719792 RepID=UPI001BD4E283|nr:sugar phosphate isomerase/epimerase [Granulicella sp. dw_53]
MFTPTRRDFLKTTSAALLTAAASPSTLLHASPFGLPIGIQLYSVREDMAKNFESTLDTLASLGYQEVEAAGFYNHSAADVKKALKNAGLACPSAHYNFQLMSTQFDQIVSFGQELGLQYIVCASPGKAPANAQAKGPHTLDDWKYNADHFNQWSQKIKAAGMTFAYHNHYEEFHPLSDGAIPFDELVRLTGPDVHFEMDCGWVVVGGGDPVACLKRYPTRIVMLHIKDFVASRPNADGKTPTPTELGRGVIDYRPIFATASQAHIKHAFVEQEGYDIPQNESLKIDADYIKKLSA